MAGPGKFVSLNTTNHCDQKEEWDYCRILKRSTRICALKIDWKVSRTG